MDKYRKRFEDTPTESETFNSITKISVSIEVGSDNYKLARF